jgi:hypothetical protein
MDKGYCISFTNIQSVLNMLVCKCEEKMLWPMKKLLDLVI